MEAFDLFVIGAGSGGVRAARMAAGYGARVAIAENRELGGTCVNLGCVPKKLLVYGSYHSEDCRHAKGYGWQHHEQPQFDWPVLRQNKDTEIARLNAVYGTLLAEAGVTLIEGRASLKDARTLSVNGVDYQSEKILIATGSWPSLPDIPGIDLAITSNEVFHLPDLPERVAIVGGGYIAVEFAGIFKGMGCTTHLLYRGTQILRGFDDDVRDFVAGEISKKGVQLQTAVNVTAITEGQGGKRLLQLDNNKTLEVDCVLYATGRTPLVAGLNLDRAGVETSPKGAVIVDENYRTSCRNIFAIGDVIDKIKLTPVAIREGMAVARTMILDEPSTLDYTRVPTAVFCQPNIGTVGLTEAQAREQYGEVAVYKTRFKAMKHSLTESDEQVFMKLIVDKASDVVLGAHMVGSDAGELIQGIGIALKAGATKAVFDDTVGVHPTTAEEFVTMRESVA